MKASAIQLRKLTLLGPKREPASVDFATGLNVICGASETGKSFIVEALDFMLGGSEPLRDIPERVGYDRVRLAVETGSGEAHTLERSIEGGNFRLHAGTLGASKPPTETSNLRAKHAHGHEDTLSGWLLARCGFSGLRIRRNQQGATQSFSFRDLARLMIVQENEITGIISPFLTGQYVSKPSEYSALKLLLTGVDDSALVADKAATGSRDDVRSKIELIDQWLAELQTEVDDLDASKEELEGQIKRVDESINTQRVELQQLQAELDVAIARRREVVEERERIRGRIGEIGSLEARFKLLGEHYEVDSERLLAIEEAGSLFFHQEPVRCPLCGAEPSQQHLEDACEGDVQAVVQAAKVELQKVKQLAAELTQTVADLRAEATALGAQLQNVQQSYRAVDSLIREAISPNLGGVRTAFTELVEKRGEVKRKIELFDRIDRLESQKVGLLEETAAGEPKEPSRTDLSKSVLGELSARIGAVLKAWHFPGAGQVYFDETAADFVIDGKPRGSRGKGLRAITHAAVTIGLMEYCGEKSLPHPGFVVLDSPLLAYWKPEGVEDNLQGTDLKDRFYEYLSLRHRDSQVVVVENEHPAEKLVKSLTLTVFTKNPILGRYGFFPKPS